MSLFQPSGSMPEGADTPCNCPLCRTFPETIRNTDEPPIRAFKAAYIGPDPQEGHRLRFVGIANNKYPYDGVSSRFICACMGSAITVSYAGGDTGTIDARHKQIGRNTSCGFYAMKDMTLLESQQKPSGALWVLEVDLWGRVIRGKQGYRAEKQRVLSARPWDEPGNRGTAEGLKSSADRVIMFRNGQVGYMSQGMPVVLNIADLAARLGVEIQH